jgi:ligand-binding sensor domain-containing protein
MGGVSHGVFGLHEDGKGNLWVGLETGVWRWRPGPAEFYAVPGLLNDRMQGMANAQDGALLIATTGAVMRLADGKAEVVYRFPAARPGFRVLRMLGDRDGGLWVGPAGRGIVHIISRHQHAGQHRARYFAVHCMQIASGEGNPNSRPSEMLLLSHS